MPKIDLFNKTADLEKLTAAIMDGSFTPASKLYVKYIAKCAAEGAVIGVVISLTVVGALAVVASAIDPTTEETE